MKDTDKTGLLVMRLYGWIAFGTFLFLVIEDWNTLSWWRCLACIPSDIFMGGTWPIYWLIIRPMGRMLLPVFIAGLILAWIGPKLNNVADRLAEWIAKKTGWRGVLWGIAFLFATTVILVLPIILIGSISQTVLSTIPRSLFHFWGLFCVIFMCFSLYKVVKIKERSLWWLCLLLGPASPIGVLIIFSLPSKRLAKRELMPVPSSQASMTQRLTPQAKEIARQAGQKMFALPRGLPPAEAVRQEQAIHEEALKQLRALPNQGLLSPQAPQSQASMTKLIRNLPPAGLERQKQEFHAQAMKKIRALSKSSDKAELDALKTAISNEIKAAQRDLDPHFGEPMPGITDPGLLAMLAEYEAAATKEAEEIMLKRLMEDSESEK